MQISKTQLKEHKNNNNAIFLWDGSPMHASMKPSIGAEHFFRFGKTLTNSTNQI